MNKPWLADISLTQDQAKVLIETQFPELKPADLKPFGEGWDNFAFLVNNTYLFRFPRREVAVPGLENETNLLPVIADKLPVIIPFPCFVGKPSETFPWLFAAYKLLPGDTACELNLSDDQRTKLAEPLGLFLKKLHSINIEDVLKHGAKYDEMGRLDLSLRIPKLKAMLEKINHTGININIEPLLHFVTNLSSLRPPQTLHLVHGDLYIRHLILNKELKLTGIIDWGDIHLGDPALDISIAHSFLPKKAHPLFIKAYGFIDPITWELAKFKAIYSLCSLISYAQDVKDSNLLKEGLRGINFIFPSIQ
jgi:aminoglycoside phosphotransferase (APT) family kinase protein